MVSYQIIVWYNEIGDMKDYSKKTVKKYSRFRSSSSLRAMKSENTKRERIDKK
jgi:hypothetical protein